MMTVPVPSGGGICAGKEIAVGDSDAPCVCAASGSRCRGCRDGFGRLPEFSVEMEVMKDVHSIGGGESEADASYVFLYELERADAGNFAAHIEKRSAAVAGIDARLGLNPCAGTGVGKFSHHADDSLCDAEEHGIAGIADGDDIFALTT